MATPRLQPHCALLGAGLLLVGCSTTTFNVTTSLPPDSVMPVTVRGVQPLVVVSNCGPGSLLLQFEGKPPNEVRIAPHADGERTLMDRATFRIVTETDAGTEFRIHAERASGLELGTRQGR